MSERPDRRVRKSRAAIFAAFESLLLEKSYSSITVSDIIERADISRSTFYVHFAMKEALLEELCADIFRHVLSPDEEEAHSFTDDPKEQLLHILHHLRSQRERLEPLFRSPSSSLFWTVLLGQVDRYFEGSIGEGIQKKAGVPEAVYAHFLATSFVESVRWWFYQALELPPEAVLDMYLTLTSVRFIVREANFESDAKADPAATEVASSIKHALIELLLAKHLEKISVAELCERACVGRSTFYNHFANIDAAYIELVRDVLGNVRSIIGNFAGREGTACDECGKMPFCERVRANDEYACVVQDPRFPDALARIIGNEPSTSPTLALLSRAGLSEAQAQAVLLFQASGCFAVARSQLGGSEDWEDVKGVLDEFVSSGYVSLSGRALIK